MISRGIIEGILLLTAINILAVIVVDTVPQGYHRPAFVKTDVGRIGGEAGPPGRRYEQDGRDGRDFSAESSEIYGPRGKGDRRSDSYGGVGQGGGSAGRGGGYRGAGRDGKDYRSTGLDDGKGFGDTGRNRGYQHARWAGKGYGDTARSGSKGFGHAGQGGDYQHAGRGDKGYGDTARDGGKGFGGAGQGGVPYGRPDFN